MSMYILRALRKNLITRFIIGALFIFGVGLIFGLIVLYPLRHVYYGIASGNFLLNVTSVIAENTVKQDKELVVTFCRKPRTRITAIDNIRIFYIQQHNGEETPVYERRLPDGIDYQRLHNGNQCLPIRINPNQRPNDPGRYRFCQEFSFYVDSFKKSTQFCSTEYRIISKEDNNG